jgi:Uma2 family endonuclease
MLYRMVNLSSTLQTITTNNLPTITIPKIFQVSYEQFQQLASVNRDLRLERTATGELIVMPPTGSATGNRNLDIRVLA